ncbi:MAG: hypothetical protein U0T72_09075 [Chitinophagales bacterium]
MLLKNENAQPYPTSGNKSEEIIGSITENSNTKFMIKTPTTAIAK